MSHDENIFAEGKNARAAGRGINSNPYPSSLMESYHFEMGYLSGGVEFTRTEAEKISALIGELKNYE